MRNEGTRNLVRAALYAGAARNLAMVASVVTGNVCVP